MSPGAGTPTPNRSPGSLIFDQGDSLKLGSNILTYVLANYEYARVFEYTKIYQQADIATRDQLVVAQLMHNGDWDPTPHGLPNLLEFIDESSTLGVRFKRQIVSLDDVDVLKQPLLYMTGLREIHPLRQTARKHLRRLPQRRRHLLISRKRHGLKNVRRQLPQPDPAHSPGVKIRSVKARPSHFSRMSSNSPRWNIPRWSNPPNRISANRYSKRSSKTAFPS